jgi:hypothetical protein
MSDMQSAKQEEAGGDIPYAIPVNNKADDAGAAPQSQTMTRRTGGARFLRGPQQEARRHTDTDGMASNVCCCVGLNTISQSSRPIVPLSLKVTAVCGMSTADLSQADYIFQHSSITVASVCGCTTLTLPQGMQVDLKGAGVCGSFSPEGRDDVEVLNAPVISIKGSAVCGVTVVKFSKTAPPIVVVD